MRELKKLGWMRGCLDVQIIEEFGFNLCCVDFYFNVGVTEPEYIKVLKNAGVEG